MADDGDKFTGPYEVFGALRDVIIASDPAKRETLKKVIHEWSRDCPDDYFWVTGMQAPVLLHDLMMEIELSCEPDATSKPPRQVIRLVDRKPQGSA
jgi:hypothetical protein